MKPMKKNYPITKNRDKNGEQFEWWGGKRGDNSPRVRTLSVYDSLFLPFEEIKIHKSVKKV